jgi:hypothetical protein
MILRKLADAISQQNWFTVVLEVLIVVVGIFIGLQVDGWNEARKDRVREIEYLQRIDAELEQDIAVFEHGVTLARQRGEYAQLILDALANPDTVRRQPTEFVRALVWAGLTYSPIVSDHTFEEIKSAGELAIIGDPALRIAITEYYQHVRQNGQWNYLREMNQTEYLKRQAGILTPDQVKAFWVTGDGSNITTEEAAAVFDKLLTKPAFTDWLPLTVVFLTETGSFNQHAKESAENLRSEIAASLGNNSSYREKN